MTQSIADGAMASVLCVLLRTPRRRSACCTSTAALAEAVHRGRPAPGRRPGRPRLGRHRRRQLLRKQKDLFLNTITILAQAVELRDEYTGGHTQRVTRLLARCWPSSSSCPRTRLELIRIGTPLHDIGKIGIDDAILRKPGRLTRRRVRDHEDAHDQGRRDPPTIPELQPIIPIVRNHHERWDGSGYPDRLGGRGHPASWPASSRWPTPSTR